MLKLCGLARRYGGERRIVEGAPDDGGDLGRFLSLWQPVEAGHQAVMERCRNGGMRLCLGLADPAFERACRADHFLDEEGDAVGSCNDFVDDVFGKSAGGSQQRGELSDVCTIKAIEGNRRRIGMGLQVVMEAGPCREDQQEASAAAFHQKCQELQRRGICPVGVLEHDDEWLRAG